MDPKDRLTANLTRDVIDKNDACIIVGVYSGVFFVGIVGNLLVLVSLIQEKKLKFPGSLFLVNMTVVDLLNILIVFPVNLSNLMVQERAIPHVACVFVGYLKAILGKISIDSVAILAFNRMILVCQPALYVKMFQFKYQVAMLLAIWLHGILGSVSVQLYGSPYSFEYKNLFCSYVFVNTHTLIWGVLFWAMLIPLIFSGICYAITYVYVHKVRMRIAETRTVTKIKPSGSKRLLYTLISGYVCYFVFILQYVIVVSVGVRGFVRLSQLAYVLTTWIGSTNYVTNSIVFGLTNRHFRRGYVSIFTNCLRCIRIRVIRQEVVTTTTVRKPSNIVSLEPINETDGYTVNVEKDRY
ncbi:Uncharacterised protein at_DN1571 [Pycnogonum litorale]